LNDDEVDLEKLTIEAEKQVHEVEKLKLDLEK
jgi:hypothetical protein